MAGVLFGSSISLRCTAQCDLDMAIRLYNNSKENKQVVSEIISDLTDYGTDIIWLNGIREEDYIYKAIERGVRLV